MEMYGQATVYVDVGHPVIDIIIIFIHYKNEVSMTDS